MSKLRVWWIPQVPMRPFHVEVADIKEAKKMLDVLARYDAFQLENNIKPDYCNTGGLECFEDGEWCNWYSEDGYGIDEVNEFGEPI
jgi:hypothetical protein